MVVPLKSCQFDTDSSPPKRREVVTAGKLQPVADLNFYDNTTSTQQWSVDVNMTKFAWAGVAVGAERDQRPGPARHRLPCESHHPQQGSARNTFARSSSPRCHIGRHCDRWDAAPGWSVRIGDHGAAIARKVAP